MWIVDQEAKVVHDLSKPAYECHIGKIPKENRKKFYTLDGVKRYVEDPLNKGYNYCQYCLPDLHEFDMTSIYQHN